MVTVYRNPKNFWRDVAPHLRQDEAKNCLSLGLSFSFQSQPQDSVYQSASFNGGRFFGSLVISRFKNNNVMLPSAGTGAQAARLLFDEFQKTGIAVQSLVGEVAAAEEYKKNFERMGRSVRVLMRQGVYRCRAVIAPPDCGVSFRAAELKDVPLIGSWIESFHREAVPHDPPVNGIQYAEAKIKGGFIYVVEREGSPVAMAGFSRDIGTSCSINLVYTPKEARGRGYASAVTAGLTSHLLAQGKLETNLFTDLANPTSNKIYQDIGYELAGDSIHYAVN